MSADEVKYDRRRALAFGTLSVLKPLYSYKLPNVLGKSTVTLLVKFPPNGSSSPHRHAGASVAVYVLEGRAVNKMNDGPIRIFEQGQTWFEAPGCHHRVCDNASKTEPATLIATFVVDTEVLDKKGYPGLVEVDEKSQDVTVPLE
ncbi:MAG: hypothetical protein M1833_006589 [Piccolia ochrophora]|nr:MAG: hypothetical protein M1833_006589 [Piccolia ochrophora]